MIMANETKAGALKLIHGCDHKGCLIFPGSSRSRGEEPLEVNDIGQICFMVRQRLPSRFFQCKNQGQEKCTQRSG